MFLAAVMDWHSQYVLSWEISVTMDEDFCISALERALRRHGCPKISNTDQVVAVHRRGFHRRA